MSANNGYSGAAPLPSPMTRSGPAEHAGNFTGPLFIVGMPRSGTKLLRDLLNENPAIGIPIVESHFIPYMLRTFPGEEPLTEATFAGFFEEFRRTSFYENLARQGRSMSAAELRDRVNALTWVELFAAILQYYAPPHKSSPFIWGDKTPGYLRHMPLLKRLYPQARILHILRDPRDYVLSVHKAWGKSIYRAAHIWQLTLTSIEEDNAALARDYHEVHYEMLLREPEETLKEVCRFLGCTYVPEMRSLSAPSENLGDARGRTEIVQDNTQKFLAQLSPSQIKRIEEIVFVQAAAHGYPPVLADRPRPLSAYELKMFRLSDGVASVRFHVRDKGLKRGLSYFLRLHEQSSWR